MKFQFQSDIHLEVGGQYDTYQITPTARYLILAGDVGNLNQYDQYVSFLRVQCQNFEKVFLGLGNHEFYNGTRAEGIALAERMTQEESLQGKLFLLHRQQFDLDDTVSNDKVSILGCTLNSHISEDNALMVRMKVHDFSKIHNWTVADHNAEHDLDVAWLRQQIRELQHTQRKILVVTHHAPFRQGCSKPHYETNSWHDAFATALLEQEFDIDSSNESNNSQDKKNPPNILRQAHTWIFGHTHYTTERTVGGVKCIANQRGYVFPWQMKQKSLANGSLSNDDDSLSTTTPPPQTTPPSPPSKFAEDEDKPTNTTAKPASSRTTWVRRILPPFQTKPRQPRPSSFKINYPGPTEGHEGDGSLPFDPLRCIEI